MFDEKSDHFQHINWWWKQSRDFYVCSVLDTAEPSTKCSLGEHSGQLTGFSGVSCQCQASWWCIRESDRDEDLAFECEERSCWVSALLKVVV